MTVGNSESAFFRRVGTVKAVRLKQSREWLTDNGEAMLGLPGDWLVTSSDGGERTVKDHAFRVSYEHLYGEEYRRVGTVRAVRAASQVVIETLEGRATALPGDWIVTAPDGSRWPVPDAVFSSTYESFVAVDPADPSFTGQDSATD